ncbi:hypothetical protein C8R48DRAFT_672098 [Suillus tomentosus]|nr:hypothetical protein C8R48DRAFT_672098 [Suillus tomentosus]
MFLRFYFGAPKLLVPSGFLSFADEKKVAEAKKKVSTSRKCAADCLLEEAGEDEEMSDKDSVGEERDEDHQDQDREEVEEVDEAHITVTYLRIIRGNGPDHGPMLKISSTMTDGPGGKLFPMEADGWAEVVGYYADGCIKIDMYEIDG